MEVREALEMYVLQLRANGRSAHTIGQFARHLGALESWLATAGFTTDVTQLDHEVLARFFVSDVALKRTDGRPKRATSVNTLRSSARAFFGYLHAAGMIHRNPARLIRRARTGVAPPKSLSESEQERLLSVLEQAEGRAARRDHALVHLMLATGLRIGSALALQVEDVDLERGEIEVRVTKGDQPRTVFMSHKLADHLREYVAAVVEGLLFPGQAGAQLTNRQVGRRLAEWGREARVQRHLTPHMLRHTFGARIYGQTGDLLLVQRAMGHRSVTSTTIYARCSEGRLREALA